MPFRTTVPHAVHMGGSTRTRNSTKQLPSITHVNGTNQPTNNRRRPQFHRLSGHVNRRKRSSTSRCHSGEHQGQHAMVITQVQCMNLASSAPPLPPSPTDKPQTFVPEESRTHRQNCEILARFGISPESVERVMARWRISGEDAVDLMSSFEMRQDAAPVPMAPTCPHDDNENSHHPCCGSYGDDGDDHGHDTHTRATQPDRKVQAYTQRRQCEQSRERPLEHQLKISIGQMRDCRKQERDRGAQADKASKIPNSKITFGRVRYSARVQQQQQVQEQEQQQQQQQ